MFPSSIYGKWTEVRQNFRILQFFKLNFNLLLQATFFISPPLKLCLCVIDSGRLGWDLGVGGVGGRWYAVFMLSVHYVLV